MCDMGKFALFECREYACLDWVTILVGVVNSSLEHGIIYFREDKSKLQYNLHYDDDIELYQGYNIDIIEVKAICTYKLQNSILMSSIRLDH